ncbi:unnamed protein product [Lathyrus oleraceus]
MNHFERGVGRSNEEDTDNSNDGNQPSYARFTTHQTSILEKFLEEDSHPNEAQRNQLARETGLEPIQVKYWFQNRRTLIKNQNKRASNNALRAENDNLLQENLKIKEALNGIACTTCGGPPFPYKEHELYMQKMGEQNNRIKDEVDKMWILITRYARNEISLHEFEESVAQTKAFARNLEVEIPPRQEIGGSSSHNHNHGRLVNEPEPICNVEKSIISQIATIAMNELVILLRVKEPFWMNSSSVEEEKLTLSYEHYDQAFPKQNHFNGDNVVKESSKYTAIVNIPITELIDMFIDKEKWTIIFPTLVSKSEIVKVFENGSIENRDGALQLMHEEMHILSPLVQTREFNVIRYCKQVDVDVWVITDVSYDSSRSTITPLARSWKHPSGCLINKISTNSCMVTWIENVEVDDKIHTHNLYRNLIDTYDLYGAKSWVKELQRMSEKAATFYDPIIHDQESAGVIQTSDGRMSVMKLAQRMVKMYFECLAMPNKLEFHNFIENNIGGIKIATNKNTNEGKPNGLIVRATATLIIPLSPNKVFEFLMDHTKRNQWDVLAYGNPVQEIGHISHGHPTNFISIIKPSIPGIDNQLMILQESFVSHVGSYVIYAPIDSTSLNFAINGGNPRGIHILSSGFGVCSSKKEDESSKDESLLTLACQTLASGLDGPMMLTTQAVSDVNNLLTTTLVKVKDALMGI